MNEIEKSMININHLRRGNIIGYKIDGDEYMGVIIRILDKHVTVLNSPTRIEVFLNNNQLFALKMNDEWLLGMGFEFVMDQANMLIVYSLGDGTDKCVVYETIVLNPDHDVEKRYSYRISGTTHIPIETVDELQNIYLDHKKKQILLLNID